ncbi:MAG: thermonuclease family protein [Pyrinomonadaceae bacterium]
MRFDYFNIQNIPARLDRLKKDPWWKYREASRPITAKIMKMVSSSSKRYRHGRIVGKVVLEGNDICIRQIGDGLAWHFMKYEDEQPAVDRVRYSRAESAARAGRIGLWRDTHPVPPWQFRKR